HCSTELKNAPRKTACNSTGNEIGGGTEAQRERSERAHHGPKIGNYQRFTDQPRPFSNAPKPLDRVGPDRILVLQLEKPHQIVEHPIGVERSVPIRTSATRYETVTPLAIRANARMVCVRLRPRARS